MFIAAFVFVSLANLVWGGALPTIGVAGTLYQIPGVGSRPLYVRNLHGVDGFQSELYEVYMPSYGYYNEDVFQEVRPMAAVAVLSGSDAEDSAQVKGELLFTQIHPPSGPILIRGNITGLTEGKHGIHVHETGDLRNGCENIGDHFNPYHLQHGGPHATLRHVGDLGNIEANGDGFANVTIADPVLSLSGGPRGIVGRAIAITTNEDDHGKEGSADSITNGSSGKVLACGIIAVIH